MPNLVANRNCLLAVMSAVLVSSCAAYAPQDIVEARAPAPSASSQGSFADLVVEGSLGHRIEILTQPGVFDRASAVLTHGGLVWRASDTCPAFRVLVQEYQGLPAVRLGPSLLLPEGFRTIQLPGRRADGESWSFKTILYGPDASAMLADLRVINGPYAAWADDAVRVIKSCGPPAST